MPHRRPSGPATARPGVRTARTRRPLRSALVAVLAGAALVVMAAPALAVPAPPPNPTDGQINAAQTDQQAAAAEVGRIAALVASAEADLEKVGVQAEAAGTAFEVAQEAFTQAQEQADRTAADLQAAGDAVAAAEGRIAVFARDTYMNGGSMSREAALLDSDGPAELLQRAATLDYVAGNKVDVLGQLEVAKVAQANADSAARAARDEMAAAEDAAQAAKAEADAQLVAQKAAYDQVAAQKATYDQQLQAAQIHLLELQGARNAFQAWEAQKAAEAAAAAAAAERAARDAAAAAQASRGSSGGGGGGGGDAGVVSGNYAKPTSGHGSSCYGSRWGVLHAGVDMAAPIGTPIYAVTSGVVKRAGAATGFGEAVYILGDDGYVSVYGHVNQYFVSAGERVSAGEQIAEVGNRGQSTGPHLHFEIHPNGVMYGGTINPVPWLNARGIYLGFCGG
jgi:murein DD-endopeptidase MepM/ murein hydrolase activator NlpD